MNTLTDGSVNNVEKRGFTLIELMISMVLMSIVLGGLFAFSISTSSAFQSNAQVSMSQLVARTALDIMTVELQMAGLGALDPSVIPDLAEADRDREMGFGGSTTNSTTGSDAIQIKASHGAMAVLNEETALATIVTNTGGMLHPQDGHDLLLTGMNVDIFSMKRELLGQGVIGALRTDAGDSFAQITFPSGLPAKDPLPTGTVIVERPVYVTYQLMGENLAKCSSWTYPANCADLITAGNMDRTPTLDNPDTVYFLANNVVDMQVSYFVISSADKTWITRPDGALPRVDRLNIRAVKLELLIRSESNDSASITTQTRCDNSVVKTKHYLGDRILDVGCNQVFYTGLSTIIHTPNNISFAGS